ncbi:MAG: helix-turn-helix domain-containing protein [Clostridia bacterium]|nr:helix-turn-helix domain-containing protein [Clostridia bacterium]
MTQSELAKKLGVKHQQISCYIKGQKMPAIDTLANLCKILDVDTNYILCQD